MIPEEIRKSMVRQHYKIIGNHSAVKICTWLKKSMRDEGFCYKQKFYGIQSHRCLQMTPWILCPNRCLFCWRIIEKIPIKGYADKRFRIPVRLTQYVVPDRL